MEHCKYDVFISYSRKDYLDENDNIIPNNIITKVLEALMSSGISFWFDKEYVHHGDDFAEKILTNIENSDLFIFISSANSNCSKWTRKEISIADNRSKKIIPFRIDQSKYDKAVELRLVDLDYIDYSKNPNNAIKELVASIEAELNDKRTAELKKKEIEARYIEEIEIRIEQLNNSIVVHKTEQKNILQKIKTINNLSEKERLSALINKVSPSPSTVSSKIEENVSQLKNTVEELTISVNALKKENRKFKSKCTLLQNTNYKLTNEIYSLNKNNDNFSPWVYFCLGSLIMFTLFLVLIFFILPDYYLFQSFGLKMSSLLTERNESPSILHTLSMLFLYSSVIISCILSFYKSVLGFITIVLSLIISFIMILVSDYSYLWLESLILIIIFFVIYSSIHLIKKNNTSAFDVLLQKL